MTKTTARLSSVCAVTLASLILAGCNTPTSRTTPDPACIRWETIKPDAWQEAQIYGPDYPKAIGPDFPKWRTLVEQMARNNANRREHCER